MAEYQRGGTIDGQVSRDKKRKEQHWEKKWVEKVKRIKTSQISASGLQLPLLFGPLLSCPPHGHSALLSVYRWDMGATRREGR